MPYATDLTDAQWALVAPFVPPAKPGGRPRATDPRRVVDAVLYALRAGCSWRLLPLDLPPWQTVCRHLRAWQGDGTWHRLGCTRPCARLGLSADTARVRARRRAEAGDWELVRPNGRDGLTRVRLPMADVPDSPPGHPAGARGAAADLAGRLATIEADLSGLLAESGRTRAIEAELAEARTRAAVAEALLEAERAAGRELRAELARLRLPFWRRWLG